MQLSGEWVGSDGSTASGDLWAWGSGSRSRIELPYWCFTESLRQGHKQSCGLSEDSMKQLWESLAAQVHKAGLVLGTHAALPPPRTN